jgi:5S rRNA maturation endonuclease (ribonuclease M5)
LTLQSSVERTRTKNDFSPLLELLERKRAVVTVVEGKRDAAALRTFGFTRVIELTGKPLYAVVESFEKGSTVQILTDLDCEGKKLFSTLRAGLTQRGIHIDNELRDALFTTDVRQVEGLSAYLSRRSR